MYKNSNLKLSGISGDASASTLEAQVNTIQSTVDGISVDTNQISTNENSITQHGIRLTTAEANITSNDADILLNATTLENHNATLTDHGTRLTTAEANITSNDNDINTINSTLGNKLNANNGTLTGTTTVQNKLNLDCLTTIDGTGNRIVINANTDDSVNNTFGFVNNATTRCVGQAQLVGGAVLPDTADISRTVAGAETKLFETIAEMDNKAPTASPTLTGTIALNGDTAVGASNDITRTVDGVSTDVFASLATLDDKAPKANPHLTGTINLQGNGGIFLAGNTIVNSSAFDITRTGVTKGVFATLQQMVADNMMVSRTFGKLADFATMSSLSWEQKANGGRVFVMKEKFTDLTNTGNSTTVCRIQLQGVLNLVAGDLISPGAHLWDWTDTDCIHANEGLQLQIHSLNSAYTLVKMNSATETNPGRVSLTNDANTDNMVVKMVKMNADRTEFVADDTAELTAQEDRFLVFDGVSYLVYET